MSATDLAHDDDDEEEEEVVMMMCLYLIRWMTDLFSCYFACFHGHSFFDIII